MPRCILHIGSPKTGTTSIQSVLKRNQALFLQHGILVPTAGQSGKGVHPSLVHKLAGLPVRPEWERADESFVRELKETSPHTVIISAEFMWKLTQEKAKSDHLIESLRSLGLDIELLCYVRNQPQFLNSAYSQGVKTFQHGMRFDRYVKHQISRIGRLTYTKQIKVAEEHGVRLTARPFSAEIRKKGLIEDFLNTVGVSSPDAFIQDAHFNQSVGPLYIATARKLFRQVVGKRKLTMLQARECVRALRKEVDLRGIEEPSYMGLTADLAQEIQQFYRESNDRFAQFAWGRSWSEVFASDVAQTFESNDFDSIPATADRRTTVREIADQLAPKLEKILNDEQLSTPVTWNLRGGRRTNNVAALQPRSMAS